ncbi:MAG: polyketide cyclase [Pseudonocardiales bacterium]|jgi:hypothetical protein|nr:polyketide cyclase [Pseudonocardiales bacterium]
MISVPPPNASGCVDIAATPAVVYGLLTDLETLTALADETSRMTWRSGSSAVPGARFRGTNRHGRRRWSTECTVIDAEPDALFAFDVRFPPGIPVSRWQYDIEPMPDGVGSRVTESTWDRRPVWFKLPAELATGVRHRGAANQVHIQNTLRRLKERAEAVSIA